MKKTFLALGLISSLISSALAANNNFTFHNQTGYRIIGLWVSPHDDGHWGYNLLSDSVDDNEYSPVEIDTSEHTDFDLKLEYANQITNENMDGHDLSRVSDVTVVQSDHTHTSWSFRR